MWAAAEGLVLHNNKHSLARPNMLQGVPLRARQLCELFTLQNLAPKMLIFCQFLRQRSIRCLLGPAFVVVVLSCCPEFIELF